MAEKIKEVLRKQILLINPGKEKEKIERDTAVILKELENNLRKKKIKAEVFIGGSLAKDTLIKREKYDIDIFVRFDKKHKDLSKLLEKILNKARKVHGSRDYFQIKKGKTIFEIVPVLKIQKPEEAENVTDLSYFHVNYVKNKINKNKKLADEIRLAKSFCYAQNCYGAEGYIRGFSGYALELLICYYGSFLKFIKAVQGKQRIILDPSKFYKNKEEILLELNESKIQSPVVFVDPTFKERNALAALSTETFNKFKQICKRFLAKPDNNFFEKQDIEKELKKKYKKLIIIQVRTNKQKGDIAGSKLRKFYTFLAKKLEKYFDIQIKEFEYLEDRNLGKIYLDLKQKKQIIIEGPPITSVEHLTKFKRRHRNCFIKKGRAYAREKPITLRSFIEKIKKGKTLKEMGITKLS